MNDHRVNSGDQAEIELGEAASVSVEEISQLLLASSLSATKPLLGLIGFLIKERVLDGEKLKAFLEPMLIEDNLPIETRAMLAPIWKSFLAQIDQSNERLRSRE